MDKRLKVILTIGILVLLVIGFYYASQKITQITGKSILGWITGGSDTKIDAEGLAKCLSEKGAVLYVKTGCPHCEKQEEEFGEAVQYLTIVNCAEEPQVCLEKGLVGVPSWEINGKLAVGRQSLEELAKLVGC